MTPDRRKRLEEIYHSARGRDAAGRAVYLAEACADGRELQLEIESLLVQGEILSRLESGMRSGSRQTAVTTDTTVGPYRIEERLDAGGMGVVYRATDTRLGRQVAIKIGLAQFIADSHNSRIRKVSTNGIITTVAGNGTFGFSGDGGAPTSAQLDLSQFCRVRFERKPVHHGFRQQPDTGTQHHQ